MAEEEQVENLSQLLDRLETADDGGKNVSIADIRDALGARSFGPFLLVIGLIGSTPASGIPGFPTIIGITVLLTAGQLVAGLKKIWLPQFLLHRSLSRERFEKAIHYLRWPASLIDKVIRPRLAFLTNPPFFQVLGACCCLIALIKPPLEFIPATSAIPAVVIAIFGLALTTHDGVMAILAIIAFAVLTVSLFFLVSFLLL